MVDLREFQYRSLQHRKIAKIANLISKTVGGVGKNRVVSPAAIDRKKRSRKCNDSQTRQTNRNPTETAKNAAQWRPCKMREKHRQGTVLNGFDGLHDFARIHDFSALDG